MLCQVKGKSQGHTQVFLANLELRLKMSKRNRIRHGMGVMLTDILAHKLFGGRFNAKRSATKLVKDNILRNSCFS